MLGDGNRCLVEVVNVVDGEGCFRSGCCTKTDRRLNKGESVTRKPYGIIATECLYFTPSLPARQIRERQDSQRP